MSPGWRNVTRFTIDLYYLLQCRLNEVCKKRFPRVLSLYDHMSLRLQMATSKDWKWFCSVREFRSLLKAKMVCRLKLEVTHVGEDEVRVLLSLLASIAEPPVPDEGAFFYFGRSARFTLRTSLRTFSLPAATI